ncbi:MAG: hypothetical protein AB7O54_11575 [Pseudomonadales bacterium]
MNLNPIRYAELNAKQKEIYNFQKVAAKLADYGFNCIKLADDWQGADFLAYHKDGAETLKVQLKGRLLIHRSYVGKHLYMAFPLDDEWYLVPHDEIVAHFSTETSYLETPSWQDQGTYHSGRPNQATRTWLEAYRL